MKSIDLLSKYPLTTKVVKDWYMEGMLKSLKNNDIPEDFKQSVIKEGVSNERLAEVIDIQPRNLFDVFDDNEIYITIKVVKTSVQNSMKPTFLYKINDTGEYTNRYFTRKEAELFAIEEAFEILENKLTTIDLPKLEE